MCCPSSLPLDSDTRTINSRGREFRDVGPPGPSQARPPTRPHVHWDMHPISEPPTPWAPRPRPSPAAPTRQAALRGRPAEPSSAVRFLSTNLQTIREGSGGERGIRTLDTVSRIRAFQACACSRIDGPYGRSRRDPGGGASLGMCPDVTEGRPDCRIGGNLGKRLPVRLIAGGAAIRRS